MTAMTGLTGTTTSPQIMTISKKEFQPCVTNRIFLMHPNSPSCQKGVAKRDTLWTQIRYAIGAKNNPQHRPSNTEGCYSLLVSSIIDLTSLSTDWISFLRYPGVTWSLDSLLFCTYMILWKAPDYKTEYVIKYYCNFCTTGRNRNFPASFCWRWYCAVLW